MAMAFQERNNEKSATTKGREDMNVESMRGLNHKTLVSWCGGLNRLGMMGSWFSLLT
jgi:hypothetical protein